MAHVLTGRRAGVSLIETLSNTLGALKAALARRAVYRRTVAELRALNDRDLADLGVHRSQIANLAHEAAYGK